MKYVFVIIFLFTFKTFALGQISILTSKWNLDSCSQTISPYDQRDLDGKHIFAIEFYNDTILTIQRTLNECTCIYHLDSNKIKISFDGESGACSAVCCDTKLSVELFKMLSSIKNGYIKKDKLVFTNKQDTLIFIKEK